MDVECPLCGNPLIERVNGEFMQHLCQPDFDVKSADMSTPAAQHAHKHKKPPLRPALTPFAPPKPQLALCPPSKNIVFHVSLSDVGWRFHFGPAAELESTTVAWIGMWEGLKLTTSIPPTECLHLTPTPAVNLSAAQLESAFAQSVRKSSAGGVARLALYMMSTDLVGFLRVMVLEMLREALLHPGLPICVWLLAAVPEGYPLPRAFADVLVEMAMSLCLVGTRDPQGVVQHRGREQLPSDADVDTALAPESEGALMHALLLARRLAVDDEARATLAHAATRWFPRFACGDPSPPAVMPSAGSLPYPPPRSGWLRYLHTTYAVRRRRYPLTSIGPLRAKDIPTSTFDARCSPIVDMLTDGPLSSAVLPSVRHFFGPRANEYELVAAALFAFRTEPAAKEAILEGKKSGEGRHRTEALRSLWTSIETSADHAVAELLKARAW